MRLLKLIKDKDTVQIEQDILGVFIEEKEFISEVRDKISIEVENYNIEDIMEDIIIDRLPSLEPSIEKVLNKNIMDFIRDDISQDFIKDVFKEALLEKLKDYSIEDILKLLQSE